MVQNGITIDTNGTNVTKQWCDNLSRDRSLAKSCDRSLNSGTAY